MSEDEAVEGVRSGKYYAAIVIPDNFSESLLSVLSGKLNTPELEYYINEKANAIAPKITSTGASTIQSQINRTFSSVAAESVSDVVKNSVTDVADAVGNVNTDINEMLKKADANIPRVHGTPEPALPIFRRTKICWTSLTTVLILPRI